MSHGKPRRQLGKEIGRERGSDSPDRDSEVPGLQVGSPRVSFIIGANKNSGGGG